VDFPSNQNPRIAMFLPSNCFVSMTMGLRNKIFISISFYLWSSSLLLSFSQFFKFLLEQGNHQELNP
jgi:hypothetical protein